MAGREKTRADDERELDMLALRCAGYTSGDIGAHFGVRSERVRTITRRIRDDHAAHSGDDVSSWW